MEKIKNISIDKISYTNKEITHTKKVFERRIPSVFLLYRKLRPIKQKTLRVEVHSRTENMSQKATVLGAKVL